MTTEQIDREDKFRIRMIRKVGYDFRAKQMMLRIFDALYHCIEFNMVFMNHSKPKHWPNYKWVDIVQAMFIAEGKHNQNKNYKGYYVTIKNILIDIEVIKVDDNYFIRKGKYWDRFFDENISWDWFTANTDLGGRGLIRY